MGYSEGKDRVEATALPPPSRSQRRLALVCCACMVAFHARFSAAEETKKSSRPATAKKTAPPAEAEPPIDRAAAKVAFYEGLRAFNLGKWDEAVAGFEKSYKLSGDPALLFNVAQAQRQAGHRKEAIIAYKAFLRENPDTPHRDLVESKIRELEANAALVESAAPVEPGEENPPEVWVDPFEPVAQAAAPELAAASTTTPSVEAAETAPSEKAAPEVVPLPANAPPVTVPPPMPALLPTESPPAPVVQTGSASNRWWLWSGIGAVVAAGVVTAVLLSTRGTERDGSCPAGVDGCIVVGR